MNAAAGDFSEQEWWRLGLARLGAGLRSGALHPERLLDLCLERVARIDPYLNSIVALDEPGGRAAARASAARLEAGKPRSPLDGIPLTIKDNIPARGMPAVWGSRAYAGFVPERDELPVARLRAAGAVIVGKTNVPELTLEGYTRNAVFGTTRNPWDPRLTPGGSSGGAAASVAAGLTPAAIGTDGGGSIRRPACHTGLVGFKPSTGRVPRVDGFPPILADFEVAGPIARSVADVALLDAVMAGPDPRDRRSLQVPDSPAGDVSHRRILYVPRFGQAPLDPEVAVATDAVADWLAAGGHNVELAPVPFDPDEPARIFRAVTASGVAWLFRDNERLESLAESKIATIAREGRAIPAADYVAALDSAAAFRRRMVDLFERVDLVLTPTAAALPWPADEVFPPSIDRKPAGPRGHAIYTGWANVGGLPAISLPIGLSASGLPIGVQFVAGFGADAALLAFAARFEAEHPWSAGGRFAWPDFDRLLATIPSMRA